jgi:hypothetical protein
MGGRAADRCVFAASQTGHSGRNPLQYGAMGTPYAVMAVLGLLFMVFMLTLMATEGGTPKWKSALAVLGGTLLVLGLAYLVVHFALAPMRADAF